MSKEKIPNPVGTDDDLSEHLDVPGIHRLMMAARGNVTDAIRMLEDAGISRTRKWLYDCINKSHALKAVWADSRDGFSTHEAPSTAIVKPDEQIEYELQQKQQRFVERTTTEAVFGDDTDLMLSFSDFASKSFQTGINMIYGSSVKSAMNIMQRAEWINAKILLNQETMTEVRIDSEGNPFDYTGPKYSEAEKLEWQKEYTKLNDSLAKFNSGATAAAEAKLKAMKLSMDRDPKGKGKGKSTRGGRDFF